MSGSASSATTVALVALSAAAAALAVLAVDSYRRVVALERRVEDQAAVLEKNRKRGRVHKPALIVLVRHGESEANVDATKYATVGDVHVRLTARGREQAGAAAAQLRELVGTRRVFAYVSPYKRTKETAGLLLSQLRKGQVVAVREDPRLREREFAGSFQCAENGIDRSEEYRYGKFFWRAPGGESPADVYDRVTAFMDTLWRDFRGHPELSEAVVVVAGHGLTNRLLVMRWLHWTPEVFNKSMNPPNCGMLVLQRQPPDCDGREYYRLTRESLEMLRLAGRTDAGRRSAADEATATLSPARALERSLSNDAADVPQLSRVTGSGRRRSISEGTVGKDGNGDDWVEQGGGGGGGDDDGLSSHSSLGLSGSTSGSASGSPRGRGKLISATKRRSWAAPPNLRDDSPVDEIIAEYAGH